MNLLLQILSRIFSNRSLVEIIFGENNVEADADCQDSTHFQETGQKRVDDVIIEPLGGETFQEPLFEKWSLYCEKFAWKNNKSLSAHTINKDQRQDRDIRFDLNYENIEEGKITISSFLASSWAKSCYDEDYRLSTLYIAYELRTILDYEGNVTHAYITFIDLNEIYFEVYPNNDIDIQKIKEQAFKNEEIPAISARNKERWT